MEISERRCYGFALARAIAVVVGIRLRRGQRFRRYDMMANVVVRRNDVAA
jgi:hypothetical protein